VRKCSSFKCFVFRFGLLKLIAEHEALIPFPSHALSPPAGTATATKTGSEVAQEARALGFEFIEISHGTKVSLLPGLMKAFDAGIIRVSSLHNFCPSPVEVLIDAPDAYEFTSHREEDS